MNALAPLSLLYGAGVALERRRRSVPKAGAASVPRVVSIGNLEAGGNGKTPLAMWWLEHAAGAGRLAAYVSRGYGGRGGSPGVVTCVLPDDVAPSHAAGLRLLARSHPALAATVGDVGALLGERVPGAMALFCADKRRAVAAAAAMGAGLVLLDDGFQSWGVARHTDVVLLDADAPLDGGQLLPAGRLREKPAALQRADIVVFNGADGRAAVDTARARVAEWLPPGALIAGMARQVSLVAADGAPGRAPSRLVAVSAIARPEAFERSLAQAGVTLAGHIVRRDHHRYGAHDARAIETLAACEQAEVVTTEKDWVKLRGLGVTARVWVARLEVTLHGDTLPV